MIDWPIHLAIPNEQRKICNLSLRGSAGFIHFSATTLGSITEGFYGKRSVDEHLNRYFRCHWIEYGSAMNVPAILNLLHVHLIYRTSISFCEYGKIWEVDTLKRINSMLSQKWTSK
ncbi:hypothetical protein CDAR_63651 [Caerostris darwini]|uniref:Uncharacterized protein n=1 Tax=Caerostris darwini TaxID=1538125 RepID=A0AAV4QIZ2_9ARAC|nr:hypothetical protein CDAR_63651 [Caerostris darwini]